MSLSVHRIQQHQDARNASLTSDSAVRRKLMPFLREPSLHLISTAEEAGGEGIGAVHLLWSPYPNRRAVMSITAVDRRCEGGEDAVDSQPSRGAGGPSPSFVFPSPLPCCCTSSGSRGRAATGYRTRSQILAEHHPSRFYTVKTVPRKTEAGENSPDPGANSRRGKGAAGPYDRLTYVLGESAVPFSALVETLAHASFEPLPPRRALLDNSWSLKWVKRPLKSDFVKVKPSSFQKLNHFPGSNILGRKDGLHRLMSNAAAFVDAIGPPGASRAIRSFYPEGYLLPQQAAELEKVLRDPQRKGERFIVKPTTAACGRGIYLIEAGPKAAVPSSHTASEAGTPDARVSSTPGFTAVSPPHSSDEEKRRHPVESVASADWVVQRYADHPFLAHGYKFDLRLYVVVTSYQPFRAYLYQEGLVRFATSPYYDEANKDLAPLDRITAHLTNFTINKKSEDFIAPAAADKSGAAGDQVSPEAAEEDSKAELRASKWSLSALAQYVHQSGLDWEGTWKRIQELLQVVFLSVRPHVMQELSKVEEAICGNAKPAAAPPEPLDEDLPLRAAIGPEEMAKRFQHVEAPPVSYRGVAPYFEIYGVDVLLYRHEESGDMEGMKEVKGRQEDTIAFLSEEPRASVASSLRRAALHPVVLEVNIMPSLSTHYSPLDQCIKGNFIADTLTLVGLTSTAVKPPKELVLPTATGQAFLDGLSSSAAVEACCTASEELHRAPHFFPLHVRVPLHDRASESPAQKGNPSKSVAHALLHLPVTFSSTAPTTVETGGPPSPLVEELLSAWLHWEKESRAGGTS